MCSALGPYGGLKERTYEVSTLWPTLGRDAHAAMTVSWANATRMRRTGQTAGTGPQSVSDSELGRPLAVRDEPEGWMRVAGDGVEEASGEGGEAQEAGFRRRRGELESTESRVKRREAGEQSTEQGPEGGEDQRYTTQRGL
ncbi:hypothetical protein ERJ75_000396300 [Trypanosoma vivax]|nr:hypothetical protein ERJ75_000396300 [Trypanosoma vivax]